MHIRTTPLQLQMNMSITGNGQFINLQWQPPNTYPWRPSKVKTPNQVAFYFLRLVVDTQKEYDSVSTI
jgi:hypothetical protein